MELQFIYNKKFQFLLNYSGDNFLPSGFSNSLDQKRWVSWMLSINGRGADGTRTCFKCNINNPNWILGV